MDAKDADHEDLQPWPRASDPHSKSKVVRKKLLAVLYQEEETTKFLLESTSKTIDDK